MDNYDKAVDNYDYFVLPVDKSCGYVDNYLWITIYLWITFIVCFARVYNGILKSSVYFDGLWITHYMS